jgi:cytochrome b subunit of formate dehydrogenase
MPVTFAAVLYLLLARAPLPADADCLACHGQQGVKSESGRSIYVDPAKRAASVHGSLGCATCHAGVNEYPHPKPMPRVHCSTCHAEPASQVPASAHGALGAEACESCHGTAHETQRAASITPQQCAVCHADAVRSYRLSVHAAARKGGDTEGATCRSCHGPTHKILPASDSLSPVAKRKLPDTCGSCHANPEFLARHDIPFARPVEAYRLSVHGRALAAGNTAAASCSDCHSNHAILEARDSRSKINHWNVTQTCGACHTDIAKTYLDSVHGQAMRHSVRDAPVCTDCHGEHRILAPGEPTSLVNPARVSSVTCGRCHSNERLEQRYNLPPDRVPAYEDSYHGLATRAGSLTVANCASCHGVHNILASSDPRSSTNPKNLPVTCGKCHAGAGTRFAIGPVHELAGGAEPPVVRWARSFYLLLIPLVIGLMFVHNLGDWVRKLVQLRLTPAGQFRALRLADRETGELRMFAFERVQHALLLVSFAILCWTGFALKYPDGWWARPLLAWETRWPVRGWVHRIAAVVFMVVGGMHLISLIVSGRLRRHWQSLWPRINDVSEGTLNFAYNLGLRSERPRLSDHSYIEKAEYWAVVWGAVVMALSGLMLWADKFTLKWLPKSALDLATAVHFYEAVLAGLAIVVWHLYSVIFDPDVYPMETAWLTGRSVKPRRQEPERENDFALEAAAQEDATLKQVETETSSHGPSRD